MESPGQKSDHDTVIKFQRTPAITSKTVVHGERGKKKTNYVHPKSFVIPCTLARSLVTCVRNKQGRRHSLTRTDNIVDTFR